MELTAVQAESFTDSRYSEHQQGAQRWELLKAYPGLSGENSEDDNAFKVEKPHSYYFGPTAWSCCDMCGSSTGFALPSNLSITLLFLREPHPLNAVGMTTQDSVPTRYPGCGLVLTSCTHRKPEGYALHSFSTSFLHWARVGIQPLPHVSADPGDVCF